MDLTEETIKEEVINFVTNLQKLLPKRKEILNVLTPVRPKMRRLTDIHFEAKNVFPKCFIGVKLLVLRNIQLNLMEKVKLSQQYVYGKPLQEFKCFTQLLHKEMELKTAEHMLIIDTSPSAVASYKQILDDGYELLLTSKVQDLHSSETELVLEKSDSTYNGSINCTIKDVDPATFKIVSQWMRKVRPEVCLGIEVGVKPFSQLFNPEISLSARYDNPAYTLSSTLSTIGFQVCCFKQFTSDIQVATVLNQRGGRFPTAGWALRKTFPNQSELKVFVDTQICGGMSYQKDVFINDNSRQIRVLGITVSALIDRKKRFKFGIGFNIDL